jgi:hypothetical protein
LVAEKNELLFQNKINFNNLPMKDAYGALIARINQNSLKGTAE